MATDNDTTTEAAPAAETAPPDDDLLQGDLYEVMVDNWGHHGPAGPFSGGYTKGQIIRRRDPDPEHYDVEHAVRTGTLRPLTVAQARMRTPPTAPNAPATPASPKRASDQKTGNEPG